MDVYKHEYTKIIIHGMLPWKWARTQKKNFIFNILNPLTNSIADLYCQSLWNHMFYNEKSFYVVHMFYQRKHKRKATGIHRQMKGTVAERKQIFTRVSSSQQYKKIKITKKKKKGKGRGSKLFYFYVYPEKSISSTNNQPAKFSLL